VVPPTVTEFAVTDTLPLKPWLQVVVVFWILVKVIAVVPTPKVEVVIETAFGPVPPTVNAVTPTV
jgi:hypothetical protein